MSETEKRSIPSKVAFPVLFVFVGPRLVKNGVKWEEPVLTVDTLGALSLP